MKIWRGVGGGGGGGEEEEVEWRGERGENRRLNEVKGVYIITIICIFRIYFHFVWEILAEIELRRNSNSAYLFDAKEFSLFT